MVEISLAGNAYVVTRPKLRDWFTAEKFRDNVIESADKKDIAGFISGIYSFLSALISILPHEELDEVPWYDVLDAYYIASIENKINLDLAMLQSSREEHKDKLPDAWEYDERTWYSWVHTLASMYGWNVEYISSMDVDDALALIQEIFLEEQFNKEWQYGLSEIAYEYDKSSKKSKLRPLTRPKWMSRATKTVKDKIEQRQTVVVRTPKSFVPPGTVILNGQEIKTDELSQGNTDIPDSRTIST